MAITKASSSAVAPGAKGDLVVGSATNDSGILAVGSASQVLTVDSSTATGLKWATASGWNPNYTLLNAGGTALTGSTDITISGISGKNSLIVYFQNASSANASSEIKVRFNSGGDAYFTSLYVTDAATNTIDTDENSGGYWPVSQIKTGTSATDRVNMVLQIQGCNSTGAKPYTWSSYNNISTSGQSSTGNGFITTAAAITSVTLNSSTGNFDAGTIYVYGA